jgi:cysteine desulfuration protein SufE
MPDPFITPEEPSAAEAITAIGDELDMFDDWMDRYQFIIELGRKLPPFPEAWQDDAHRVPGCQSKVWMEAALRDGRLFLGGMSDAAIVSGLIALLLRVYSGRTPSEIVATDPVFLKDLGLLEALSTNRGNGIAAMARKIRELAALHPDAGLGRNRLPRLVGCQGGHVQPARQGKAGSVAERQPGCPCHRQQDACLVGQLAVERGKRDRQRVQ